MKIVVSKTALSDAVKMLSQVLNRKNALPILGDFHFEVAGNNLTITASDSEITLQQTIEVNESEVDGKFCVNANQLKDALVGIYEQPITLDVDLEINEFRVKHSTGETYFAITSPIADEYPLPAEQKYDKEFDCESGDVADAISRCAWATSTSELRPNMCGVYFDIDGDGLTIVASNGHVIVKTELYVASDIKGGFILSKKAALILAKQPKGTDLHVSFNQSYVLIEADGVKIYSRLVDDKYPAYNSVIPEEHNCVYNACLNRFSLINVVHKILPFTLQSGGTSRISLEFAKEDGTTLTVAGDDYDMGMGARDTITIEEPEGDISKPYVVGFNGANLEQLLKNFNHMDVTFYFFGENKGVVIKEKDAADDEPCITMLIMPVLLT